MPCSTSTAKGESEARTGDVMLERSQDPGGAMVRETRFGSPRTLVILLTRVLVSAQHLVGLRWLQGRAWGCRHRRPRRGGRGHRAWILLRCLLGHSELRSGKAAGRAESRPPRTGSAYAPSALATVRQRTGSA
jgi:hypothetical protein